MISALLVAALAACSSQPESSGAANGSPSQAATSATPSKASGDVMALVTIAGLTTTISGGSCGSAEYPPDVGGGHFFGVNIGALPTFESGGPDYLGMIIDTAGQDPDGTYEMSFADATGTLVASGETVPLTTIAIVIADDGARSALRSKTTDGRAVEISIAC